MGSLHINGGKPLVGEVSIQGSKNGALPLLTATVLIQGKTVLHNCPGITDINAMAELLKSIGCIVTMDKNTITIDATHICDTHCPQKQVQAMRSSIMLLGPLLGRCKSVRMSRPGGCVIGARPTDIHEMALRQMNVRFEEEEDTIFAYTDSLIGADILLPFPSVGATENVIMAAVLAQGSTRLRNAAREPEIVLLCEFLRKAGARIRGIGGSELEIEGVKKLREVTMTVMPDRIVAGTYLLAAAATRGQVLLKHAPPHQMHSLIHLLRTMGAEVFADDDMIYIDAEEATGAVSYIKTGVYPGFPTDLQSMLLSVLAVAYGESVVEEAIFEDRFKVVEPLQRMGAQLSTEGRKVRISGVAKLRGAQLRACELRGGAALVIAALAADGESVIEGCHFIDRGYENIARDLRCLGADISRRDDVRIR
ncbi:MAG: UDP-N-acetylglucosamine 1-carboxyvinyltransferase [Lachnospiraceae bacterium]|nr:UDP-N-acetylglucosamine 1-carboxyvinyltransferase [Lachnospiraceae bacterium]